MRRASLLTIILILWLGLAVRASNLNDFSLHTDEGWSAYFTEVDPLTTLARIAADRHPPLYFVVLSQWQQWVGTSRFALRLFSVIGGLLTIALTFRLAADYFDNQTALLAALLLAVLDIAVYYSQELRHYGWLATVALVATLLLLRYYRQPRWSLWGLYALAIATLMYTHYFGAFTVGLHVLWVLARSRQQWHLTRRMVAAWAMAFILYLPWLWVIVSRQWHFIRNGVGGFPNSFASTPEDLLIMLGLLFGGHIALLGGAYLLGVVSLKPLSWGRAYIVVAGMGVFTLLFMMNLRSGVLSARMISFLTPYLMILSAHGLRRIPPSTRITFVGIFVGLSCLSQPIFMPRIDLIAAADTVAAHYANEDHVILELGWTDFAGNYALQQAMPIAPEALWMTVLDWSPEAIVARSDTFLAQADTIWVVQWLHAPVMLPRLLDGWQDYRLVGQYDVANQDPVESNDPIRLYRFQRPDLQAHLADYDNGLRLHDAIFSDSIRAGMTLRVDLWWQTARALDRDYSVALLLKDAQGTVVAQNDASLANLPSSQWLTDDLQHGEHQLVIPMSLATGSYALEVLVYYYEQPSAPILTIEGDFSTVLGQLMLVP